MVLKSPRCRAATFLYQKNSKRSERRRERWDSFLDDWLLVGKANVESSHRWRCEETLYWCFSFQSSSFATGYRRLSSSMFFEITSSGTSVREHSMFEKTTDHDLEISVKKWLVYAKDREGAHPIE
ncbi:hypothetical protein AVEN_116672-1 [Araneus ventricosus]|uniref:Uncharacterized protein n=1 Tax=Araneus ventricosus TaxID=182803 RepID=A0A4Y2LUL1_ARAVE|nr:hypothetical protein AVEN_116672-1 [Araneus ventricosus]